MNTLKRTIATWRRDRSGATAMIFAVAFPVVLIGGFASVEYGSLVKERADLQGAADAGALGAAKQLNLANPYSQSAVSAAIAIVKANITSGRPGAQDTINATIIDNNTGISVDVARTSPSYFSGILGSGFFNIAAHSAAHATGGPPICAIAIDPKTKGALTLDANATVDAHTCAVYVDSRQPHAISAAQSASLRTSFTCAVGGKSGNYSNFTPQPQTGCPGVADPLASRPPPTFGLCDHLNLTVSASTTLMPGVYCGGLHVTSGANVYLQPGVYIISGGPLFVDGGASLFGANVGFYLTNFVGSLLPVLKLTAAPGPASASPAPGTTIYFAQNSTINLTAPKTGAMSGLLFFEDRIMPPYQLHQILSDHAQNMVGTIYLSRGRLFVGSNSPVSADSAYTVVVAATLELSAGPTLVLNSNYSLSDVPVPLGVGPTSNKVSLTR